MKTLKNFVGNPAVQGIVILVSCLYTLHSVSNGFVSAVHEERDTMAKSLRAANAPESQIIAITSGFDNIAEDVDRMAVELFSFATIALTVTFFHRRSRVSAPDERHQYKGNLVSGKPVA
jgi:hypothetical protein